MSRHDNTRITIIVVKHAEPSYPVTAKEDPADRIRAAYREEHRQIAKARSLRDSGQLSNSGYRKRLVRIGTHTDRLVHEVELTDTLRADLKRIAQASANYFSPQAGKIRKPRDCMDKGGDHSTRSPFTQSRLPPLPDDGRPSTR